MAGDILLFGTMELHTAPQPRVRDQVADNGLQAHVAVGDMDQQQPLRGKFAHIELDRLAGHEVHRHRIGAEGIDDQEVEAPIGLMRQKQPAVPEGDPGLRRALAKIAEAGLRRLDDGRIDLEEGPRSPLACVTGDGSGAESDHADPLEAMPLCAEDLPQGALAPVIAERLAPQALLAGLRAMDRVAMDQKRRVRRRVELHAMHAEETAMAVDLLCLAVLAENSEQQRHRAQRHGELALAGREGDRHAENARGQLDEASITHKCRRKHPEDEEEPGRNGQGSRLQCPTVVVTQRPKQENGGDRQGILGDVAEHERRDQRVEGGAQQAADGHPKIELGETSGRGPARVKVGVAEQREQEQDGIVHRQLGKDRAESELGGRDRQCHRNGHQELQHQVGERGAAREGDDEGGEIEGQRRHPQQRHRRDVGGDVGRDPDQQRCGHRREDDPPETPRRGRRVTLSASSDEDVDALAPDDDRGREGRAHEHRQPEPPPPSLIGQVQVRLDDGRVGNEADEAAEVGRGKEPVRLDATRKQREPALGRRARARQREERESDHRRQDQDEPEGGRPGLGRARE